MRTTPPISLAAYCDDPMFQLARAYAYNKVFAGRPERDAVGPRTARKKIGTGKRLRIDDAEVELTAFEAPARVG